MAILRNSNSNTIKGFTNFQVEYTDNNDQKRKAKALGGIADYGKPDSLLKKFFKTIKQADNKADDDKYYTFYCEELKMTLRVFYRSAASKEKAKNTTW